MTNELPQLARISHHAVSGIEFGGFEGGYWSVGSDLQWKTVGFSGWGRFRGLGGELMTDRSH